MSANFALEWQPLLLSNLAKQKELVVSTGRSFTVRKHSSWEKNTLLHYCHEPWTPSIKSNPNHIDNAHNSTKVDFLLRPSRLLTFPTTGIGARVRVMLFIFTMGIWPFAGGHSFRVGRICCLQRITFYTQRLDHNEQPNHRGKNQIEQENGKASWFAMNESKSKRRRNG